MFQINNIIKFTNLKKNKTFEMQVEYFIPKIRRKHQTAVYKNEAFVSI